MDYERIKWVKNGLKVRCVKRNEYFRQKGVINDIIDGYRFTVLMDDNTVLTFV